MSKKGFIAHPMTWIFIAFLAGIVVTYLAAQGIINVPIKICPR
ncbi:MAG: hypothetical protein ABIH34_01550 [Nanoarchaeota archaeon]